MGEKWKHSPDFAFLIVNKSNILSDIFSLITLLSPFLMHNYLSYLKALFFFLFWPCSVLLGVKKRRTEEEMAEKQQK